MIKNCMMKKYIIRTEISTVSNNMGIIKHAARLIQKGELVAFPTETVYGLGADAFNPNAVKAIFSAKKRPETDPLIVHIYHISELKKVAVNIPKIARDLARFYWPGPLTLILEKHPLLPSVVTAGNNTVAVRMPSHMVAQFLIKDSKTPIAAPSANLFSRPSPTLASHVLDDLDGKVSFILDDGPTDIGIESTILDLTVNPPCILRPGGLPVEEFQFIIPNLEINKKYIDNKKKSQSSPGQFFKHYSPKARLLLFSGSDSEIIQQIKDETDDLLAKKNKIGILATDENVDKFKDKEVVLINLGSIKKLETIAKNLFASMRELDSQNVDYILMQMPPENGIGRALQDRLVRAAYR